MMLFKEDLNRIAEKFVTEEIALAQDDISSAVKSKEWLLDRIKAKIKEWSHGPQLYAEDPQIGYGSYFVRVKVTDVDEMDFLLVVDSNSGVFRKEGVVYGTGLGTASPNYKYDTFFMKADGTRINPNKLLVWLRDVCWEVLKPLGGEMPQIDGPAVKVVLKTSGIKFDLVPAGVFKRTDGSGAIFYNIPEGNQSEGWVLTNPRKDIERVEKLAEQCEGFRNVVRLVKFVRDSYGIPISSYAVQCAVCQYAERCDWQGDLFVDFQRALVFLEIKLRNGVIEDGFDPAINLLKDVSVPGEWANVVQAVYLQLDALSKASNEDAAYDKLWQLLKNSTENRNEKPGLTSDFDRLTQLFYPNTPKKNPWSS